LFLCSHAFIVALGNSELYIPENLFSIETKIQPYFSLADLSAFAVFNPDAYWYCICKIRLINF
ncbi:MAG: hypothetical protein Q8K69_05610, partial [Bacteroidota bacterium]|nr:hypothetical protein [Bacteroidota bacterium]